VSGKKCSQFLTATLKATDKLTYLHQPWQVMNVKHLDLIIL